MSDAAASEKAGSYDSAISQYLQAADLLLLLGKVEDNYNAWKQYTDTAAQCQQKARSLIPLASRGEATS